MGLGESYLMPSEVSHLLTHLQSHTYKIARTTTVQILARTIDITRHENPLVKSSINGIRGKVRP